MPNLLVIPPLTMYKAPSGRFVITRKFLDGLAAYAHYFPGKVTSLLAIDPTPTDNLDHIEFNPEEHTFEIRPLPAAMEDLQAILLRASSARSIVLGSLCYASDLETTRCCNAAGVPIVLITEYALETRRQIIAVTTGNPLRRWKRHWSAGKEEKAFRQAATLASGLQCNGTPTYDDYHILNPRTLLFFDTRIRHAMLPAPARVGARIAHMLAGSPLRLAFSGRLIAMKGADHLPVVAGELRNRNIPFTLDICGAGDLEGSIAGTLRDLKLTEHVRLRGNLDFATELVPLITDQCDLFIQCHPQGDPSCTYLETMACGVPIAGYDNAAFRGIARTSKTGFPTPLGQPLELVERIAELHADRQKLATAAWAALEFASEHTFEKTMQMRVQHMLSCMAPAAAAAPV